MPQEVEAIITDIHGHRVEVENGALAVAIQDQHSRKVGFWASQFQSDTLVVADPLVIGSYILEMVAGHGLAIGNSIFVTNGLRAMPATVLAIANLNTLTIDSPLVFAGQGYAGKVINNMNVDGSGTPEIFAVSLPSTWQNSLDIKGVRFHIDDGTDMDDGLFGGMGALTRGVVIQKYTAEVYPYVKESAEHYFNIKSNGDFQVQMDNMAYLPKAPSGQYSMLSEWKVSVDEGITARIDPGDVIRFIIQDDLRALISFRAWLYGHVVIQDS